MPLRVIIYIYGTRARIIILSKYAIALLIFHILFDLIT